MPVCQCRGRGRGWKEAALALQYFERAGLKVSEGLGMVMEMESIHKFGPKRYRGVGE